MTHYDSYDLYMMRIQDKSRHQHREPDSFYVAPFLIAGNIYYIGNKAVCSHLIDTGDGLIVIDTSYPELDHLLIQAIWEAGFNPRDIRIVLHTHAHYDHFGATVTLQKLFGAKAYLGRHEWESVSQNPRLLMLPQEPDAECRMFQPDRLLEDGDEIQLGSTVIHCMETPGHSLGTMSYFFDTVDHGITYRAGMFGGAGFITLYKEYFLRYGIPDQQAVFLESIRRIRQQPVDIVLGNHPAPNRILEKREKMLADPAGPNPFIDPSDWGRYLERLEQEFLQFRADGY